MKRLARIIPVLVLVCSSSSAQAQLAVSAQSSGGSFNQIVNVDVALANPGSLPIDAFGFRISYPSTMLDFQSVSAAGTLTESWIAVSGNETGPGVAQIGGFHFTPLSGSGVLLRVTFLVTTNVLGSGTLSLSDFVDDVAGAATVNATFTTVPAPGGAGLLGEYYNDLGFTGTLLQRVDATVNFDWGLGSPDPSMGTNDFTIRWTGWVTPAFTQTYTFYTITDDGVRLWVNNQLVIDHWLDQAAIERSGTIALTADVAVPIRMEMYEQAGEAVAILSWQSTSQAKQVIPSNRLTAAQCAQGLGDLDASGVLGAADVACAFEVYLADQTVAAGCDYPATTCELTAADVNCSGSVTPADARAIEIRAASSLPPVSCFATPDPAPSPPLQLGLVQNVVDDGGTQRLEVRIAIDDAAEVDAFGARLAFPAAQLQLNRVEAGFATSGWHIVDGRLVSAGQVNVGGFDPFTQLPPGTADVCRVYFDFLGAPGTVAGLALSNFVDDFAGATVGTVTDVDAPIAAPHRLHQNYPNPFNPTTQVRYEIGGSPGERVRVRIAVYDVRGALVRVLVDDARAPGLHVTMWDGRASDGSHVASGVYFYSMHAGAMVESRRMVLLK